MSNQKKIEYFSMTLNPDKERDQRVCDILHQQPQKAKSDFVKNAILAHAERDEAQSALIQTVRDTLAEELPALIGNLLQAIPTLQDVPAPQTVAPLPQENTKASPPKPGARKALGFMAGLQETTE